MDEEQPRRRSAGSTGSKQHGRRSSIAEDSAALERLGHKQELKRNFSMISMLGLAFAILNTWTALAASISLALPSGGTSAVIWGLVVAGICNLALAASLAEFLSAYPTAGGQYHWAAIVSWKGASRGISYATGWINVSGWVALSATGGLLGSTFVVNIISLLHADYDPKPWHQFLIYIAFTAIGFFVNAFLTRLLPYFTKAAFFWSISGFVIISITVLACASPNYQSGAFVYGHFINEVGWPNGLAWMLGLLQGAFALTGEYLPSLILRCITHVPSTCRLRCNGAHDRGDSQPPASGPPHHALLYRHRHVHGLHLSERPAVLRQQHRHGHRGALRASAADLHGRNQKLSREHMLAHVPPHLHGFHDSDAHGHEYSHELRVCTRPWHALQPLLCAGASRA